MLYQEIMAAVRGGDTATIQDAFRRLVDFPHEGPIHAAGPGPLVVALNAVCEALVADESVMPRSTCEALETPPGSSYAIGVALAKVHAMAFGQRFKEQFQASKRRAG